MVSNYLLYTIGLCILIIIPLVLLVFFKVYESFEDVAANKEESDIHAYMTVLSDALCPVILHMKEETTARNGLQGTESEKQKRAMDILAYQAGGSLFECPIPSDPVNIPINVPEQVVRSIKYLYIKVDKALIKTKKALNCKKLSKEEKEEGFFAPTSAPAPEQVDEQSQQPQKPTLSPEDRAKSIHTRAIILGQLMSNQDITNQLVLIQSKANELLTLKKLAEENKIRPTCQKDTEEEADNVKF
jgi:hypothetical protein